jgi:hypothetical protein
MVAAALAIGIAASAWAQGEGEAAKEAGRMTEFIMYTQWMDAFRTCGMEEPEKLPKLFLQPGSTAALEWAAAIEPNFLPETQADFFRGAIPLAGPYSGKKMVMGLFNPYWNAMMLLQVTGTLPQSREELEGARIPAATSLLFMSGEAFRGEQPEEPDFSTVLPGGGGHGAHPDEPLSAGIWRAQVLAMRRFNAVYPAQAEEDPRLKVSELGEWDKDRDLEMLIARVGVRLKCLEGMHLSPERSAVAERMEQVLQLGHLPHMKRYFEDPLHDTFVTTFAKLPDELKRGFRAYGCVAGGPGTLYLLVNQEYPRLYATVSVPAGRLENRDAGTVAFEWYDLDLAEELLAAWASSPRTP